MKKTNNTLYTFFIALLMLASGCIQENPDLVNPPLVVETVNVRFFNLAQDEQARSLWFDSKEMSSYLAFNATSTPDNPPFDSVTVEIFKDDGTKTYSSPQKLKFGRLSNYIMLALPNLRRRTELDTGMFNTDTLIYIQSTTLKPDDTNQCYIKFLNANPDTSANYSIKIGCPNGENLFIDNQINSVNYMQSTGTQLIYEGKRVVSILKNTKSIVDGTTTTKSDVIGIFELDLKHMQQYVMIANKRDEVYFFNELEPTTMPIMLTDVPERTANVRIVNLSSQPVSVSSAAIGDFTANLASNYMTQYSSITTCDAMTLDRIYLQTNGAATDTIFMSFDIYKNYSLLAFDADNQPAAQLVAVPPVDERMSPKPGMAIVRVVNANYSQSGITVSTGAATADNTIGYASGAILAANLLEGECSKAVYLSVPAGIVPISVFATVQPTRYLFSTVATLESGKEYILAVDQLGGGKLGVIELTDEQKPVTFAPPATFVQVANVTNGQIKITLNNESLNDIISSGNVASGELLTTFVPKGNNSLSANGVALNFNTTTLTERTLLLATGTVAAPELFSINGPSMGAAGNSLKWRFVNAATDVPIMDVYQIEKQDTLEQNFGVQYKATSKINTYHRDKKYSFVFKDVATNKELYVATDLLMTLAKNYTIVLWGNANAGYQILILQEY